MNKWNVIFVLFLFSCKHQQDVVPAIPTNQQCDTSSVKYAADIKPILKEYCFSCHAGSAAINGFDFENFDNIKILSLDTPNYIPTVIADTASRLRMPPPGYPIPSLCSINKMKAWVNKGALNN